MGGHHAWIRSDDLAWWSLQQVSLFDKYRARKADGNSPLLQSAKKELYPLVSAIGVGCLFAVRFFSFIVIEIKYWIDSHFFRSFRSLWLDYKVLCPSKILQQALVPSVSFGMYVPRWGNLKLNFVRLLGGTIGISIAQAILSSVSALRSITFVVVIFVWPFL